MHMQGIHYDTRHDALASMDNARLMSFAGNAFHTWACGPALLALLLLLAEARAQNEAAGEASQASAVASRSECSTSSASSLRGAFAKKSTLETLDAIWGI